MDHQGSPTGVSEMHSPFQISVIALWGILTSFLVSRMNFFFFLNQLSSFFLGPYRRVFLVVIITGISYDSLVVPLEEVQRLAVNEGLIEIHAQSRSRWSSARS